MPQKKDGLPATIEISDIVLLMKLDTFLCISPHLRCCCTPPRCAPTEVMITQPLLEPLDNNTFALLSEFTVYILNRSCCSGHVRSCLVSPSRPRL
jgi:hypothetical protein